MAKNAQCHSSDIFDTGIGASVSVIAATLAKRDVVAKKCQRHKRHTKCTDNAASVSATLPILATWAGVTKRLMFLSGDIYDSGICASVIVIVVSLSD